MIFKLYTQDSAFYRRNVATIVGRYFDGFSMFPGTGMWKGDPEPCVAVEIVVPDTDPHQLALARGNVSLIVDAIKAANNQESVLAVESPAAITHI